MPARAFALALWLAAAPAWAVTVEYRALSHSLMQRAEAALDTGKMHEADDLLQQAIIANPLNAPAYILYGRVQALSDKPAEAVRLYGIGLNIDPTHRQALQWRGEAYLLLNERDKAQDSLTHLTELCGDCREQKALAAALAAPEKKR